MWEEAREEENEYNKMVMREKYMQEIGIDIGIDIAWRIKLSYKISFPSVLLFSNVP